MDLEPDPEEGNADDGEYFETDQKSSPPSSPQIHEPGGSSESDHTIVLSSDSDEEEEERGYDVPESSSCWKSTPRDERGERVLIHINTQPITNPEREKTTKRDVPIPLPHSLACREPGKGWTVKTVDGKHYIPCPECQEMVRIVSIVSLKKHMHSSHGESVPAGTCWHCQLCLASSNINHKVHPSDVINHMSQKHRINIRGPMSHPAWVPTDSSAKTFICPECRIHVPTRKLKNHMKFYKLSTGRQVAYPCSLCPKTERKIHVDDLQDHLKFLHGIFDEKAEKEKKSNMHKQFQSKDCIQCKGCKNPVNQKNLKKHLDKCQGLTFCGDCKEHILVQDLPSHSNSNCGKSAPKTTLTTNLNPPQPQCPDLIDNAFIQCKGCRNQVKKVNFVKHLDRCQGFGFCRGCNQRVLVQKLSAHRRCGKLTPTIVAEPQVPELIDDMSYSTLGAVSLPGKGPPKKAVQINLLQKQESTFYQENSVDSDSPTLQKPNEVLMSRIGQHATSNSNEAKGPTILWSPSSLEKRNVQSGSKDGSAWKRKKTTVEEVNLTQIPS